MQRPGPWPVVSDRPRIGTGSDQGATVRRVREARPTRGPSRVEAWLWQHWLLVTNGAAGLLLVGAILPPVLDTLGLDAAAATIRAAYQVICAQRPSHSFFLFGYQLALEQRMLAIDAAQLVGGLLYAGRRGRVAPLGWGPLAVLTLPIAWDGFSQMLGLRDSDWLTRSWTGGLFALASVAATYPRVDRLLRSPGRDVTW